MPEQIRSGDRINKPKPLSDKGGGFTISPKVYKDFTESLCIPRIVFIPPKGYTIITRNETHQRKTGGKEK